MNGCAVEARIAWAIAALIAAGAGACAYASGYDPATYPTADTGDAAADPETEPLPPSAKRRMRDPRGVPVFDAGAEADAGTR